MVATCQYSAQRAGDYGRYMKREEFTPIPVRLWASLQSNLKEYGLIGSVKHAQVAEQVDDQMVAVC